MTDRNKNTVYVGGLSQDTNETELYNAFYPFGDVAEVHIPRGPPGTPHRGFAFVVLSSTESAEDAIDNMHLSELNGKIINVNFAKPLTHSVNSSRPVWQDEVSLFVSRIYVRILTHGAQEWIAKYGSSLSKTEDAPEVNVDAVPATSEGTVQEEQ